jgi:hypothetical protein
VAGFGINVIEPLGHSTRVFSVYISRQICENCLIMRA